MRIFGSFIVFLACALLLAPATLRADEDDADLERLRDAVAKGQVLPLAALRERLLRSFPGDIVKTELEIDDGRFVYEFKVLGQDGLLLEIEMDAVTGQIVDVENDD